MPDSCDPVDCSLPGSSVYGISQARTLEWVAISFSRGSSPPRLWTRASCIESRFFTSEPPEKPAVVITIHPSASCRTPINQRLALIQCDRGWGVWNAIKVSWQHFCISPPLNYLAFTIILAIGLLFMKSSHRSQQPSSQRMANGVAWGNKSGIQMPEDYKNMVIGIFGAEVCVSLNPKEFREKIGISAFLRNG